MVTSGAYLFIYLFGAGGQFKQHVLSTHFVQGTLLDVTQGTKIDESPCLQVLVKVL